MDEKIRGLRHRARAGDLNAEAELFTALRRAGQEPTFDDLVVSHRWHKVVGVVRKWFVRPLEQTDGATPDDLTEVEARLGLRLPETLREWYSLIGRRAEPPTTGLLHRSRPEPWLDGERLVLVGDGKNFLHFAVRGTVVECQLRYGNGEDQTPWQRVGDLCPDFFAGLLLHQLVTHYGAEAGRPRPQHAGHVRASAYHSASAPAPLRKALSGRYPSLGLPFTITIVPTPMDKLEDFTFELCGDADTVVEWSGGKRNTHLHVWTRTEEAWHRIRDLSGWGDVWERGPRGGWRDILNKELDRQRLR